MFILQCMMDRKAATLHVFEQDGAWHWGITIPRGPGFGFQVIAYNTKIFTCESDAMSDGNLALKHLIDTSLDESREVVEPP